MIEQDIKTIISLLEALVGKPAIRNSIAPMPQGVVNTPDIPQGYNNPVPPVVQQVVEAFEGRVELPAATTQFEDIKKSLIGMSKVDADTWYHQCLAMGKSEKQKSAITKIFKDHLA